MVDDGDDHSGPAVKRSRRRATVLYVSSTLRFTIRYSHGEDGWIMAQVEEVPGAISQGRTRAQARENVIDALRLMLTPEPGQPADPDREPLDLPLAS
jgi:predicted RNase H-like HicB family nuclease